MNPLLITIIGNLSYALGFASFIFRNMLYLRIFTILSSLLSIVFYYYAFTPQWTGIIWKILFILVNIVQIVILAYETTHLNFTAEEQELHRTIFNNFTPVLFKKLIKAGVFANAEKGELLTEQGKKVLRIILICKGLATVEVDGEVVAYCKAGNVVGEMSLLANGIASATVRVSEPTHYVMWLVEDIQKLLHKEPSMSSALQQVLNKDLINKLMAMQVHPVTI